MLENEDYSSDSSDEDFVPDGKGQDDNDDSADDSKSSGDDEFLVEEENTKKLKKKQNKKTKINPLLVDLQQKEERSEFVNEKKENLEILNKKKANNLWADFLADVEDKPAPKPKTNKSWAALLGNKKKASSPDSSVTKATISKPVSTNIPAPSTVKITKIFEFAGEEVKVEKEVSVDSAEALLESSKESQESKTKGIKRPLGLSGIVGILDDKKKKLSTLEKTKLDWNSFKTVEGIEDQLEVHKKSKHGYLDKQAFLERTDLREFEIEKNMRTSRRSNR